MFTYTKYTYTKEKMENRIKKEILLDLIKRGKKFEKTLSLEQKEYFKGAFEPFEIGSTLIEELKEMSNIDLTNLRSLLRRKRSRSDA